MSNRPNDMPDIQEDEDFLREIYRRNSPKVRPEVDDRILKAMKAEQKKRSRYPQWIGSGLAIAASVVVALTLGMVFYDWQYGQPLYSNTDRLVSAIPPTNPAADRLGAEYCLWRGEFHTYLDKNQNAVRDEGEPLIEVAGRPDVRIAGAPQPDTFSVQPGPDKGEAELRMNRLCGQGQVYASFRLYDDQYRLTSVEELQDNPEHRFEFGIAPLQDAAP